MTTDFVVGVELCIQDTEGNDIMFGRSEMLSDQTMQMIIEDVAEFLTERESDYEFNQ